MKLFYVTIILAMIMIAAMTLNSCKQKTEISEMPKVEKKQTEHKKPKIKQETPQENSGNIKVALIIDDFGANGGDLLQAFCELDSKVSFAIMPGLAYSKTAMKKAVASGHETIIHIPMQPINFKENNPGSNAILMSMTGDQISQRVEDYIDELPYCIGANNHEGSAITGNLANMIAVLQVLKKHNMFFIDSATTSESMVAKAANQVGIPTARRRIFLDVPDTSPENTIAKIKDLEKIGAATGTVIVIGHCHNARKLEQIQSFIQQVKDLGYDLIPISKALPKTGETT